MKITGITAIFAFIILIVIINTSTTMIFNLSFSFGWRYTERVHLQIGILDTNKLRYFLGPNDCMDLHEICTGPCYESKENSVKISCNSMLWFGSEQ